MKWFSKSKGFQKLAKNLAIATSKPDPLQRDGKNFYVKADEPMASNSIPQSTEPTHGSKNQREPLSKPKISTTSEFPSLVNKKPGILKAIDENKLSYDQVHKVWDKREAYMFTPQEESILETYKNNVKPYAVVRACRQCGMVGNNCTCNRSWF